MDTLFKEDLEIKLPVQYDIAGKVHGTVVRHVRHLERRLSVPANEFTEKRLKGVFLRTLDDGREIAIIPRKTDVELRAKEVLRHPAAGSLALLRGDRTAGIWLAPQPELPSDVSIDDFATKLDEVLNSWKDAFRFHEEQVIGDIVVQKGLRKPQIGAIHATLGHWTASAAPATVVMPTGTGKTETMLALLAVAQIERLLVVVPSDALRTQISDKFLGLGVLKESGCLASSAKLPVVATMEAIPRTTQEIDEIFLRANVIVTTMDAAAQADPAVQLRMAELVSHLFVDEAHHIGARTWREFKANFKESLVLQFTATPYRTDGRRVDGKFIYVYPLAKAYAEGYFKKIRFDPVYGLDREDADLKIVRKVGETLRLDAASGHDHLVMARCKTIDIAIELHRLYVEHLSECKPVLVHSKQTSRTRQEALRQLRAKESRIVVCVDMLGEGFDLPDLKIAALHDKHKSEAITVQFVGRFTRTRKDLGDATIIANVVSTGMRDSLRALYSEDADWNHILEGVGTRNTAREERRQEVLDGFDEVSLDFPVDFLNPRMGAVVYETTCENWDPNRILDAFPPGTVVDGPYINQAERLAIFIKREEERLKWTSQRQPVNTTFHLYACHWDDERQLLFITSSNLSDLHGHLAAKIAGPEPQRIRGERVFRVLDGYRRLILSHLGLTEAQRRPIRYSQFMGSDIAPMLYDSPENRGRLKTNVFGQGYNDDGKSTIGCSTKGKIWSYDTVHGFSGWIDWCRLIGTKLLDPTITTDGILRRLVKPVRQNAMPDKHATAINWPEVVLHTQDDRVHLIFGDVEIPLFECDIRISSQTPGANIVIRVGTDTEFADFTMTIDTTGAVYAGGAAVGVRIGKKTVDLVDWFKEEPPHIYYADGDTLVDFELLKLPDDHAPAFDPVRLVVKDWSGVDISKESQGRQKDPKSIQRRVIDELLAGFSYDLVFDDDGAGESADVVAIKRSGDVLKVDFFHLKYSGGATPGARVADLYEVCGQTQKSIRWRERPDLLLAHLKNRETASLHKYGVSRLERGTLQDLVSWLNRWNEFSYEYEVTVVQPGYSKSAALKALDRGQLELLAATQSLLMDTWTIPFSFQCSA